MRMPGAAGGPARGAPSTGDIRSSRSTKKSLAIKSHQWARFSVMMTMIGPERNSVLPFIYSSVSVRWCGSHASS